MLTDTYIPRRLDDPWKLGFWDIDVAAPVVFAMLVGYASSSRLSVALCTVAGRVVARCIARIKVDKHPAFAMHWLYWHLPTSPLTAMQATPPSHIRRMVG